MPKDRCGTGYREGKEDERKEIGRQWPPADERRDLAEQGVKGDSTDERGQDGQDASPLSCVVLRSIAKEQCDDDEQRKGAGSRKRHVSECPHAIQRACASGQRQGDRESVEHEG